MEKHLLKYKTKEGKWVTIPYTASDIYDKYVEYCESHTGADGQPIKAVTKDVYYKTLGELNEIVERFKGLATDAENLATLAAALTAGTALPLSLGGTGTAITGHETFEDYLKSFQYLTSVTLNDCEPSIKNAVDYVNRHNVVIDNKEIDERTFSEYDTFYFQYED